MLSLDFTCVARRAAIVSSAAAIVLAAACSDDTTAPRPATTASVPTSGAAPVLVVRSATVTVSVKNVYGALITELPQVRFFAAKDSFTIQDNSVSDKNRTPGIITVSLPVSASYGACLFADTKTYGVELSQPHCKTVFTSALTVDLGSLVMHEFPIAIFEMQDIATFAFVPGGEMKLIAPDGTASIVGDGGVGDIDGVNDGNVSIRGKHPGTYTFCETKAPTGYWVTNPICRTESLGWDMGVGTAVLHFKKGNVIQGPS